MAGATAVGCNLMRALCGDAWAAREVRLAFHKPADVEPYRRFFRAPISFDAEGSALLFPAATLELPVGGADAEREVLGRPGLRLADIAASLGYADASAFARAFRRWSGTTPTEWRRRKEEAGCRK
jgi:AraC-like DNA-binding protein